MAVPVLVCLFALASLTSEAKATTTVTMDEKSFAVIVPVKEKDKYISITVVTSSNEEDCNGGSSETVFDEPTTDEVISVLDEKKTRSAAKTSH